MTFQCEVPRGPREGETVRAGPAGDQHLLHCHAGMLRHTGRAHQIVFTATTPKYSFLDAPK